MCEAFPNEKEPGKRIFPYYTLGTQGPFVARSVRQLPLMATDDVFDFPVEDNSSYAELPPLVVLPTPPAATPKRRRGRPPKVAQQTPAAAAAARPPTPPPQEATTSSSSAPLPVDSDDESVEEKSEEPVASPVVAEPPRDLPISKDVEVDDGVGDVVEGTATEQERWVPVSVVQELCAEFRKERKEMDERFWDLLFVGGAVGLSASVLLRRIISLF